MAAKDTVRPMGVSSRRPTLERQHSMERHPGNESLVSEYEKSLDLPYAVPDHIVSTPTSRSSFLHSSLSADDSVFGPPKAPTQSFDSPSSDSGSIPPSQPHTSSEIRNFGAMQPMNMSGQRKRRHPPKPGKHVCQYCGRAWAKPSVLEKHIRMHTGERPYPCDICDQSFKTKSNLYKHRKSFAHLQKCQDRGVSLGSTQESFNSSREESLDIAEGDSFADDDNHSNAASYSRSGSFGSAYSLDVLHPKTTPETKLNNNYNKPPNTEHPSKLLTAADHLMYVGTLRKLEQVYNVIEEYAKKMKMIVSQRAHWIEDKHCVISVQLQQRDSLGLLTFKAAVPPPVNKEKDMQDRINQIIKENDNIMNEGELPRRRLSRQASVSIPASKMLSANPIKHHSLDSGSSQPDVFRNGAQGSALVHPQAILNAEHLDGEELLREIRQIIQNSCIDETIKLLLHAHCMEVKLKLSIPNFHATVGQPKLAHFYSQAFTAIDPSMEPSKSLLGHICQKCKTVFSKEHILELHTRLYCFPDDQQVSIQPSPSKHPTGASNSSILAYRHVVDEPTASRHSDNIPSDTTKHINDGQRRAKLLKARSDDTFLHDERNFKKFNRSKSDIPASSRSQRAQLHHQSSDGASTRQQLKNHVLKHMSHGSLGTETSKSGSLQSSASTTSDEHLDITSSSICTPIVSICITPPQLAEVSEVSVSPANQQDKPCASDVITYTPVKRPPPPEPAHEAELSRSSIEVTEISPSKIKQTQKSTDEFTKTDDINIVVGVAATTANTTQSVQTHQTVLPTDSNTQSNTSISHLKMPSPSVTSDKRQRSSTNPTSNQLAQVTVSSKQLNTGSVTAEDHTVVPISLLPTMNSGLGSGSEYLPTVTVSCAPTNVSDAKSLMNQGYLLSPTNAGVMATSIQSSSVSMTSVTPSCTSAYLPRPLSLTSLRGTPHQLPPAVGGMTSRYLPPLAMPSSNIAPAYHNVMMPKSGLVSSTIGIRQPTDARMGVRPIILSPMLINRPGVSGGGMLTLAMPSPPARGMPPLAFVRAPVPGVKTQNMPMSPLVYSKTPSLDKSGNKKQKRFELHPTTPDSYRKSTGSPGMSSMRSSLHRPSVEMNRSLSRDVAEGSASPRVSFNVGSRAPPISMLSVPSTETPASPSLKLKRRRFSQTKSQSSVSFDEPVATMMHKKRVTPPPPVTGSLANAVIMPVQRITMQVASTGANNNEASIDTKVGNDHLPTRLTVAISLPNQSTSAMTLTTNHPITYQLFLTKETVRPTVHHITRPDIQTMNRESLSVECRPSYCTLHNRTPSHIVMPVPGSVHTQWKSSVPKPSAGSKLVDPAIPMSCYNTIKKTPGRSSMYKASGMDTRSILTHSSYWQYKNKMRVMHSMPNQDGLAQPATPRVRDINTATIPKLLIRSPSQTEQSTIKSLPSLIKHENNNTAVTNNNRPSVITRDPHNAGLHPHKKTIHRSQSTPNAGGDAQSKLIAGGFKSDEDYVYIRGRGKGKYVCQQCGIRCRKPSMLKKHIRTHTDLRPYSCKHCNFSFKTKGNLTKHMRSKAHYRRCLELNIIPVPSTVDDSQIDMEILASQQKLSRESKIKGAAAVEDEDDDDSDGSDDEDNSSDDDDDDGESSTDDMLHIDENKDGHEVKSDGDESPTLPATTVALRRAQSMPAHHMANSFDASTLADMLPQEPQPPIPKPVAEVSAPAAKKRKKNHLNLTISTTKAKQLDTRPEIQSSNKIEDDIARSLLDLSQTPVHGTPNQQTPMLGPGILQKTEKPPSNPADVKRVSVVRSTKIPSITTQQSEDEPMDLRVSTKAADIRFMCPLCRAICSNQENLTSHMKLHDGPVIEVPVPHRNLKRLSSQSMGGSMDGEPSTKQAPPRTPRTPSTPLRRQHAVNIFDSDAEEEEVDHQTKIEPGEKPNDSVMKRKCPYCPKIFMDEKYVPIHVKSHHLMAQEYVCTYKECGEKFNNKQDLTFHLGTHALDDTDKYQPISIPKCGVCEKTFKSVNSLKQHLQHHNDARPHVCEYCDAGFTTAQSLKHHLKTHTQERPYVCGECGNTFARSDHLSQHAKTHKKFSTRMDPATPQTGPTILDSSGNASENHTSLR